MALANEKRKGITLIALVITIIVLLILAGITISLALGQNGIFKRALQAKQATRISEVKEEVQKWLLNNEINEKLGYKESIVSTADFLKELKDKGKITEDEYNKAVQSITTENPKIAINNGKEDVEIPLKRQDGTGSTEQGTHSNPQTPELGIVDNKSIKRGDIINYVPTGGVADKTLLIYVSPKGDTSKTTPAYGGNGIIDQGIVVDSTITEWQVLKNDAGKITLILREPTKVLQLKGGQGWLYAEREIHKACSIYGYGKGADKSQVTKYTIGNPFIPGEAIEETITGSGARSITLEDLEELGNIDEEEKKRLASAVGCEYGEKGSKVLKREVKVPTINSKWSSKESEQIYKNELVTTDYGVPNPNTWVNVPNVFGKLNDLVFPSKGAPEYFIASRKLRLDPSLAGFGIVVARENLIDSMDIFASSLNYDDSAKDRSMEWTKAYFLRPVVTLTKDVELIADGEIDGKTVYRIK